MAEIENPFYSILYARKLSDGTVSETSLCVHLGEKFIESALQRGSFLH